VLRIAQFAAILSTALALAPGAAHALELPNKMQMARADYLITQRIYRGWNLLGIVVVAQLVASIALARLADAADAPPARLAVALIVGTQLIFWLVTFPVNRRTDNWSQAPEEWIGLRRRWELSHACSALLNLAALICVIDSALVR
jgi:hypothetical protein